MIILLEIIIRKNVFVFPQENHQRIQYRFLKKLFDVVCVVKCLKLKRSFRIIVLAIVFLRLTTYVLTCVKFVIFSIYNYMLKRRADRGYFFKFVISSTCN